MLDLCAAFDYLNTNSDVYLGFVGWAAGAFDSSYVLSLTPTNNGGKWTDQPLFTTCFQNKFTPSASSKVVAPVRIASSAPGIFPPGHVGTAATGSGMPVGPTDTGVPGPTGTGSSDPTTTDETCDGPTMSSYVPTTMATVRV